MFESFEKIVPKKVFLLVALVYFASSLVQVGLNSENRVSGIFLGLPRIYTGDEPGYLVTVFSLVNDSDLHLSNNIQSALSSNCDRGASYAGKKISLDLAATNVKEFFDYPFRPIQLPLTAAVCLMPFKNSCILEPLSIWLSLLATVFGIMFFYFIAKRFFPRHAVFFTLVLAFCTPIWHYSRTFWTEPWTFLLLTSSFYFLLVKNKPFLSSLLISVATLFHNVFLIPLAIFVIKVLLERKKGKIIAFVVPMLLIGFVHAVFNLTVFGSLVNPRFLRASQGNIAFGFLSALFNPSFGMVFSFPPILFFAFALIASKNKKQLLFPLALLVPPLLFFSSIDWIVFGTGGYGFRYMAPFFGVIVFVLGVWFEKEKKSLTKKIFCLFLLVSFLINVQAAFFAPLLVNNPPWFLVQWVLSNLAGILT